MKVVFVSTTLKINIKKAWKLLKENQCKKKNTENISALIKEIEHLLDGVALAHMLNQYFQAISETLKFTFETTATPYSVYSTTTYTFWKLGVYS